MKKEHETNSAIGDCMGIAVKILSYYSLLVARGFMTGDRYVTFDRPGALLLCRLI